MVLTASCSDPHLLELLAVLQGSGRPPREHLVEPPLLIFADYYVHCQSVPLLLARSLTSEPTVCLDRRRARTTAGGGQSSPRRRSCAACPTPRRKRTEFEVVVVNEGAAQVCWAEGWCVASRALCLLSVDESMRIGSPVLTCRAFAACNVSRHVPPVHRWDLDGSWNAAAACLGPTRRMTYRYGTLSINYTENMSFHGAQTQRANYLNTGTDEVSASPLLAGAGVPYVVCTRLPSSPHLPGPKSIHLNTFAFAA